MKDVSLLPEERMLIRPKLHFNFLSLWFTIEGKWWPFFPMATSCYVQSLLPHCQYVRLLLQLLHSLTLQKCSELGLRFPDRKSAVAKAQAEIMLRKLENKIIFKNLEDPQMAPFYFLSVGSPPL